MDDAELRTLATIGAFRVVPVEDLDSVADLRNLDLRRLSDDGLITSETLADVDESRR